MSIPVFTKLAPVYTKQWAAMNIAQNRVSSIDSVAKRLIANKDKYMQIQDALGIPWFFVAVLHQRESSANFSKHLHNGDPLTARTKLVPAGRPKTGNPPFTWVESALDALKMRNLHKIRIDSIERFCYEAEGYNGWGYYYKGIPSAYLWSFSNIYKGGKYIADGVWSSTAMDAQMGVMPLLKRMMALDPTIQFTPTPVTTKVVDVTKEKVTAKNATLTTVVGAGAASAQQAVEAGYNWYVIGGIGLAVVVAVVVIYVMWKKESDV